MSKSTSSSNELQIKMGAKQKLFLVPAAALALSALAFLAVPYITTSLKAAASGTATTLISATVTEAWASLTTSGNVALGIESMSSDTLIVQNAIATAATNSPSGYSLYLSAHNTSDNSSDMVNIADSDSPAKINSLGAAAPQTFSNTGTWGYAVKGADAVSGFSANYTVGATQNYSTVADKGLFRGLVPTTTVTTGDGATHANGLIATRTSAAVNGSATDVYYGAYISPATTAGTYAAEVVYTMVADFTMDTTPEPPIEDPNKVPEEDTHYAYTEDDHVYYYGSNWDGSSYTYYRGPNQEIVTAYGVSKNVTDAPVATIANIADGNITWAAVAIVAGASATFLAIALLRDREDEDDEEQI